MFNDTKCWIHIKIQILYQHMCLSSTDVRIATLVIYYYCSLINNNRTVVYIARLHF
jgi:hypothetical protein